MSRLPAKTARGDYVPADPSLRDFARKLIGRAPRSIEEYVREIEIFGAFLDGRLDGNDPFGSKKKSTGERPWAAGPFGRLPDATFSDLHRYYEWLHYDRKLSVAGIRRKLAAVRAYYRYRRDHGHREDDPSATFKLPKLPRRQPKVIAVDEVRDLRQARPPAKSDFSGIRNAAIVSLLYSSGVRRAELVAIDQSHVDLKERTISVIGKGNKQRTVVFDFETAALLQRYLLVRPRGEDDALFLGSRTGTGVHRRISYDYIRDIVARFARESGLERTVTPHMLRHSLASYLVKRGVDLKTIGDQLGHENLATTSLYLHGVVDQRRARYDEAMEP